MKLRLLLVIAILMTLGGVAMASASLSTASCIRAWNERA
jgi:hypothetical protein